MIDRFLEKKVFQSLKRFPAVGLLGARQVGKTTLAKMVANKWAGKSTYFDLERPTDYVALAEPERILDRYVEELVIIDEVQLRGDLFPVLRSLIDDAPHAGRFLLLGSSSPDLIKQSGESLAGRIVYHELSPLLEAEMKEAVDLLWCRGGFPRSALAGSEDESVQWRENFISTYLQRDLAAIGYDIRIPTNALHRLWQLLAHMQGQFVNLSQLAVNLEISRPSVARYLSLLEETFMIRRLEPYHLNVKKRLVKRPKLYLRDSGLLHTLLGIDTFESLMGHAVVGASWEGFCIEQIHGQMPGRWQSFFYRTQAGAEVDMVLIPRLNDAPILVEFKHSLTPKLTKGFWSTLEDLHPQANYVVYPGDRQYPLAEGVEVLPITQIEEIWK